MPRRFRRDPVVTGSRSPCTTELSGAVAPEASGRLGGSREAPVFGSLLNANPPLPAQMDLSTAEPRGQLRIIPSTRDASMICVAQNVLPTWRFGRVVRTASPASTVNTPLR